MKMRIFLINFALKYASLAALFRATISLAVNGCRFGSEQVSLCV